MTAAVANRAEAETAETVNPRRAWYVVGIMAALYGVSFIDRYALALVVDPVSQELGLTDSQMGLALGAGFAMVYAVAGLPLAQLVDQYQRRLIVVFGAILWSCTTIATAFAHDYATLFACRAGVAIGEAVLTPAAISMIADLFPKERRAWPVSIYGVVATVMGTGAFAVGGAALALAEAVGPADVSNWRIMFIIVGLPGLLFAMLLLLTVKEPKRRQPEAGAGDGFDASVGQLVGFVKRHWLFFLPYFLGTGTWTLVSASLMAWAPSLMIRSHGAEATHAGLLFGMVSVPFAIAGTFFWPWLAKRLAARGTSNSIIKSYMISAALGTPAFGVVALAPTLPIMLVGTAVLIFAIASATVLGPLAIQTYGPSRMHGRLMAMSLLFKSVIGLSGGPLLVSLLAERWKGMDWALGNAMAAVGFCAGILTLSLLALSLAGGRRIPH